MGILQFQQSYIRVDYAPPKARAAGHQPRTSFIWPAECCRTLLATPSKGRAGAREHSAFRMEFSAAFNDDIELLGSIYRDRADRTDAADGSPPPPRFFVQKPNASIHLSIDRSNDPIRNPSPILQIVARRAALPHVDFRCHFL